MDVVTPVGCRRREELGHRNWEGTGFTASSSPLELPGEPEGREPECLHQAAHLKVFITHSRGLVLYMHCSKLCERRGVIALLPRKQDEISSVPCPSYH